jgi:protein-S-isoprenylcysteine O-methyltransferase Ste14
METLLRLSFLAILTGTFGMSAFHRYRARRNKPGLSRLAESSIVRALRLLGSLPLLVILILYCFAPSSLEWAELPLPQWIRWFAVALGGTGMVALWWVFQSIGDNISETILTKSGHELVTHGPYQLIRHPLYTFGLMQIFALGLISTNILLIGISILGVIIFRCVVIPREEANLRTAFGQKYASYQANTWALIPWVT